MAKMEEVYGFSVDPATIPGRYLEMTVDHLFGTVWTSDELDVRERRLMTIGVLAAQDQSTCSTCSSRGPSSVASSR